MKKYLVVVVSLFPLLCCGAPFWNLPSAVTQPDGSVLNLFASGDEYANRLHDAKGFTVIQSSVDGYYYYATVNQVEPVPSVYRYGTVNPEEIGLTPNIDISREARQRKIDFMKTHQRSNERGPNTGSVNNLCVYIRFSDQTEFEIPRSVYNARFNEVGDNAVSLRSYFQRVSYNQLHYMTYHYPVCADDINLSYQDSHPRSYFLPYNAVTNTNGYWDEDERTEREHTLLNDAIYAISSQVPTSLNIDADNDNYVDNVCFIIRGPHSAWSDLLWAHRWGLYTYHTYINGKRVWDFTFQPEDQNDVSTLCHEMFHSAGAPDLYHYTFNGITPVGCWDIMESGDAHPLMYMKYQYGEWISAVPDIQIGNTYTLNPVTSSTNNVFKYPIAGYSNQYLFFEYRKKSSDIFEDKLPGSGLLIYRVNQEYDGNADGPPDEIYVYRPNGTVASNGLVAEATFSADSYRTAFNVYTNPQSFLNDGTIFPVNINNITETGETISFTISSPAATMAPVISSITPASGSMLPLATIEIEPQLTDPANALLRVEYTLNGSLVYTANSEPFTGIINSSLLTPGVHNVGITAVSSSELTTNLNVYYRIIDPNMQNWFSWLSPSPIWFDYGRGAIPVTVAIDMDLGTQEYIVKGLRFRFSPDSWGEPEIPGLVTAQINRFTPNTITDQVLLDLGYIFNATYDPNYIYPVTDTTHISGQIAVILNLFEYQNIAFDQNAACGHSWLSEPNRIWTDALGRGIAGAAAIELLLQKPNPIVDCDDPLIPAPNIALSSYPNPFSAKTKIKFTLPESGEVTLSIYNLKGQKVTTLQKENKKAGNYELEWNGTDIAGRQVGNGIYFCRIETGGITLTSKLLKLK